MATIRKKNNKWEAIVRRKGINKRRSFILKAKAEKWARELELAIEDGSLGSSKLLREVFDEYELKVSRQKAGFEWEARRLNAWKKYPLADMRINEISSKHIVEWRDLRLAEVKPSTVNRELNLLSHVFTMAEKEWEYIPVNPCSKVRRPRNPEARTRRISDHEIELLRQTCDPITFVAFEIALETGMRLGEICQCDPKSVKNRSIHLPAAICKNRTSRDVPLSERAVELLEMWGDLPTQKMRTVSKRFELARKRAGIMDLTFHDTRHEAISRLSKKINVLSLAKMVGHRDIRQLMTYYDVTADEIAQDL